ncbi:glycosyltransferase family 1 protein [Croceibacterium sp. LX-88]|uniref:Glycosyltransferase family 1 protein n=1 Tax=Croceibacterium selenioxidans TaxID=2838833 RepID=A0ABS5W650_9SPHN|nr:glycosyltransferase family 1 protein [Croceibacterium selenioxidans]MBT2135231.1 glycosyltransferase family 1 protein [Croceibacterium selenioxidans]
MRIAIVTDAWDPQVNGVVRTLHALTVELSRRGHEVEVIAPCQFRSVPCPTYPEIRLALAGSQAVGERLAAFCPEAIHISTEGPLGWAARRWCLAQGRQFTTAYHTQFPEYLARRSHLPAAMFWPYIRHFHAPSSGIMAATATLREQLAAHGLTRLRPWGRGVDLEQFGQDVAPPDLFLQLPRPVQLYVGRVAVEKNVEAFLSTRHPGSKVVVGDGPALARLQVQFPDTIFVGRQSGRALAACYAGADVFVFPSRTDTFGLVMIEALASGTPVAAYPVPGPLDVLTAASGCMAESLEQAIAGALQRNREHCRTHGRSFTWEASTDQFLAGLTPESPQPALYELRAA